jgi:hypothetical protein
MPAPHDELPIISGEPRDLGCTGCPGCGSGQPEEGNIPPPEGRTETGLAVTILAPMGLFLLPVVTAMLGALWGTVAPFGELLGGLGGLAFGMGVAVLAARIVDRRKEARDAQEPPRVDSHCE